MTMDPYRCTVEDLVDGPAARLRGIAADSDSPLSG